MELQKKSKSETDWSLYKRLRNHCTKIIRKAKNLFHRTLLREKSNSPQSFWSCIKRIFPTNGTVSNNTNTVPFIRYDGKTAETPKEKANVFANFFMSVAKNLKEKSIPLKNFIWKAPKLPRNRINKKFKYHQITHKFVRDQFSRIKPNKAAGLDQLPPRLLKDCTFVIVEPLCHLLNLIKTKLF